MKIWMGEPEMNMEIHTDWQVGNPFIITGFHHVQFENRGILLALNPESLLQYTHLSSVSHLPDLPQSYSITTLQLIPDVDSTRLTVTVENFPTLSIFKHLDFYWRGTIHLIRKLAEEQWTTRQQRNEG